MKKRGSYIFHGTYEELQPFPVTVRQDNPQMLTFTTEAIPCLGYALRCRKRYTLSDTMLTLHAEVKNMGEKAISTEEYCHNFFCIDGMSISPDYYLYLPLKENVTERMLDNVFEAPGNLRLEKNGIAFLRQEQEVSMSHIAKEEFDEKETFCWRLKNRRAKAWVEGKDKIAFSRMVLWSCDHIISPEIFQKFSVQPGETFEWERSWTFGQNYNR